jgi:hypothetical protein
MKVHVQIPKSTAIQLGIEPLESHEVEIDLASLSEEDRALVAAAYVHDTDRRDIPRLIDLSSRYHHSPLTLSSTPTVEHVLDAIRSIAAVVSAEEAAKKQKHERVLAEARQVLRERRTRLRLSSGQPEKYRGHETGAVDPDWPDHGTFELDELTSSPEATAWVDELAAGNQQARKRIDVIENERDRVAAEEKEAARVEAASIRDAWIREHGSERLRWLLDEGMELEAVYRDERLELERPGWVWSAQVDGDGRDPRNPPIEAKAILDEARKLEPEAELRWLVVEHEHDDCEDEDECPRYESTRYVAVAEFLGREILFPGMASAFYAAERASRRASRESA